MIANARMYSVSPEAAELWRRLLSALITEAGAPVTVLEHPAPKPLEELWGRPDIAAVFMCGLPFSRADPQPELVAAPVPSLPPFADQAGYWSEFVVRADSGFDSVEATFGRRIAFTVPESQSGCVAALTHFMRSCGAGTGGAAAAVSIAAGGARPAGSAAQADDGARAAARGPLYREIVGPVVTPLGALAAVVQGAADIAPIDSYAWRLLERYRPDLTSQVRVVGRTARSPIPPLVASAGHRELLQPAFLEAHRNPAVRSLMDQLLLRRFAVPDAAAYAVLRERFEETAAYWRAHRFAAVVPTAFVTNPG